MVRPTQEAPIACRAAVLPPCSSMSPLLLVAASTGLVPTTAAAAAAVALLCELNTQHCVEPLHVLCKLQPATHRCVLAAAAAFHHRGLEDVCN